MNIGRRVGGANYAEGVAGYRGQGVRGAVVDTNIDLVPNSNPPDFHNDLDLAVVGGITYPAPLLQTGNPLDQFDPFLAHGTAAFGIMFGHGIVDPMARGFMPLGQGIFAYAPLVVANREAYSCLLNTLNTPETCRNPINGCPLPPAEQFVDPQCPYRAVLQSLSYLSGAETNNYTIASENADRATFKYKKLLHLTSFGNTPGPGNIANPDGWAKNILTVGAVTHKDSECRTDDYDDPVLTGSNGPALDGRIKPDLCFFYDAIYTTADQNTYIPSYGGTSGACPMVAGCAGLFYEMWGKPKAPSALVNIFGRTLANAAGDVFDNRCSAALTKAMLINTARQYEFSGPINRYSSGWGWPDVRKIHELRDRFPVIVDENILLQTFATYTVNVTVGAGVPALKATLVYTDPPGTPMSTGPQLRNDLTLRASSPTEVKYIGNHGLVTGHWSSPNGTADTLNNVENIFIQNPLAGVWTFTVKAEAITMDGHPETPQMDADFALVVSLEYPRCPETDVSTFCAPCTDHVDCCDANVCSFNRCTAGECGFEAVRYGNVNGDPNNLVNLDDILCWSSCFSNFASCPNADLHPPCTGNGICNLDDYNALMAAYSGADPCGCQF